MVLGADPRSGISVRWCWDPGILVGGGPDGVGGEGAEPFASSVKGCVVALSADERSGTPVGDECDAALADDSCSGSEKNCAALADGESSLLWNGIVGSFPSSVAENGSQSAGGSVTFFGFFHSFCVVCWDVGE